jgi:DNA-binding MarR family transcriptional regulator
MPDRAMQEAGHEQMLEALKRFRILLRSMQRHYRSVETRAGLGGAQLWALAEIAVPGGVTMGELAAKLAVHLSTASNLVRRLETLGLAVRSRSVPDQRVVRVAATSAGRQRLARSPQPAAGPLQMALLQMPTAEVRALCAQLDRLLALMAGADRSASATPLGELLRGRPPGARRRV